LIRKPEGAERASVLRRTAEAGIEAGEWVQQAGQKTGRGCQVAAGWYLAVIFLFGALTASSWGARIFGVAIVGTGIYIARRLSRALRDAA
jgi:hypothetical protein